MLPDFVCYCLLLRADLPCCAAAAAAAAAATTQVREAEAAEKAHHVEHVDPTEVSLRVRLLDDPDDLCVAKTPKVRPG